MNINQLVGENIAKARKSAKLTQEELSALVQISRVSICNIEAGKQAVNVSMLYRLCLALDVPMGNFLPDEKMMAGMLLGEDVVTMVMEKSPDRLRKMLIGFLTD